MNQCQCKIKDGTRCKLFASKKPNTDHRFCWRHQACTSIISEKKYVPIEKPEFQIKQKTDRRSNITDLPKNMQYEILVNLQPNELAQMCVTNKKYREICANDKFWKFKIGREFQDLLDRKPYYLTFRAWYFRLLYSGNLFTDIEELNGKMVATNVSKAYSFKPDCVLFIDIFDQLFFVGKLGFLKKYFKVSNVQSTIPVLLKSNVIDIFVGDIIAILTHDGTLIYNNTVDIDDKSIELDKSMENVVQIFNQNNNSHKCLILTKNADLYVLEYAQDIYFVDKNVDQATFDESGIYYITKSSQLIRNYFESKIRSSGIEKLGQLPTFERDTRPENTILIHSGVGSVTTSAHYLIMTSTNNKIYFYDKKTFIPKHGRSNPTKITSFNQEKFKNLIVTHVSYSFSTEIICIIDINNNVYFLHPNLLAIDKLTPTFTNCLACVAGDQIAIITKRFQTTFDISKINTILDEAENQHIEQNELSEEDE